MEKIILENNYCPVARSLEIVGDRWTLLILRDMFKKKAKHFQTFLSAEEKISPNILSARLKKLVDYGVIEMSLYSEHPPRYEYTLTKKGIELGPILQGLWDWGKKFTSSE
ncbi:MAG: helix-turn-helix domain-containing protein [Leptospiraceae bacterium]|nr:helix-turn-helix domain-containing protein [Leptospiraceae bacterium]